MAIETVNEEETFQGGKVALIASAHGVHDTYTAFLPALLPVLISKFGFSNTTAGSLSVFLQIPSLFQPIIGHIADNKNLKILTVLAPAVTGVAMSLLAIAPGYGLLMVLLLLAGISSAALHAVSPVIGSSFAGDKLGRSMSYWMVGGELGRSLGPLIIVTAIEYLTPGQVPWLMIGGFMTSIFLYYKLQDVSTLPVEKQDFTNWKTAFGKIRRVMIPVSILVFARALAHAALTTYLPTYMTTQGSALWIAGASLTILQVAGMIGALLAGWLSDRFGRRIMLFISYITVPFLIPLFLNAKGFWQIPVLILLGFFAIASVPIFLAVVMENSPENKSFANGVYMAISFIINAISVLLVGALADFTNFQTTFLVSAGLMALGLPFIFMLPKMKSAPKLAG